MMGGALAAGDHLSHAANLRVERRQIGEYLAQAAIVFAAYFVAGKLGQATSNIRSSNLGPVWPAYGVALASFLLCGYQVWFGIAAAAFLVAFSSPVPHVAALGQATGATLAALTGAFLLRRVAQFRPSLSRLRDALALIVLGALGSAMVSATNGVSVLYATHVQAYSGLGSAWLIYWLGDATGVLLVAPLILTAPDLLKIRPRDRIGEFVVLLLLLTATCFIVFGDLPLIPIKLHFLAFAVLPFVMWAAIRFGVSGAALSTLLVATIATVETALGAGPFAQNTPFTNAVLLDVYFAVLSVSGMTLAAVIAEREHSEREREELARKQAAMEVRLRLATIVESSDDAIIGTDRNGIVVDWNKGAEQLYGYSGTEAIGKPISLLVPPDRPGDLAEIVGKHNTITHFETVHQSKDGRRIAASVTMSPIRDIEGGIVGASVISRDITERNVKEAMLRESEQRFRLVADSAPVLIWMSGLDKLCTYFNKPWLDFTGRSMDEESGHGWAAGVHPEDLQNCMDTYTEAFDRREEFRMEYRLRRHDREYRSVLDIGVPRFDQQRAFVGYIGVGIDVTERKHAEVELRDSEERFRLAAQAGRMFAYTWDAATDQIVRSAEGAQILGIHEALPSIGKQVWTSVYPDDRERVQAAVAGLTPEKPDLQVTYRIMRPDGTVIWVERQSRAHFDAHGKIQKIVGMIADVTERKRTENALQESEARLLLAVQAGRMYAFEWDTATDVIIRSSESVNILKWSSDPTHDSGRQFLAAVHPDDRELYTSTDKGLTPENPAYQISYRLLCPDGVVIWLEDTGRAFFERQRGKVRVVGMVADVTERKQAEDALSQVSRRLIEAQEQERTRIARELHDDMGQRLALLAVELEELHQNPPVLSEIRRRVGGLHKQVAEITTDIQSLSHELHSSKLEYLGIAAAMRGFCKEFSEQQDVEIDLRSHDLPSSVAPDISLCLFRVLQEALHNSAKHSGVRHIEARIWGAPDEIHLTVSDSGAGFDSEAAKESRGLGLISMKERLKLLKGTFSVESQPQRGTTIHACVPLRSERSSSRAE
jgi:PAS domain S-box-containing protein